MSTSKQRCYCCDCLIKPDTFISIRFYKKERRDVRSRGFYHLEQVGDKIEARYNEPYTVNCMAQKSLGAFTLCRDCGEHIYNVLKSKKEFNNGN